MFNPSLAKNNAEKPLVELIYNQSIKHLIVFGENDEVVRYQDTIGFLSKNKSNYSSFFENNGHRTPLEIFQKYCNIHLS